MNLPEVTEKNLESYKGFMQRQPLFEEDDLQAKLLAASLLDDERAAKQVFNSHLRFVYSSVNKLIEGYKIDKKYPDRINAIRVACINEGNAGLYMAIKKYHKSSDNGKFMSFMINVSAVFIKRYLANNL